VESIESFCDKTAQTANSIVSTASEKQANSAVAEREVSDAVNCDCGVPVCFMILLLGFNLTSLQIDDQVCILCEKCERWNHIWLVSSYTLSIGKKDLLLVQVHGVRPQLLNVPDILIQ
jgi:hypothetical protein